jgi:Arc/MetJ-type ribon-helix-helix transcriptional regulator
MVRLCGRPVRPYTYDRYARIHMSCNRVANELGFSLRHTRRDKHIRINRQGGEYALSPLRGIQLHTMSIQIAVRLAEASVSFIDEQIRSGRARSRADVISKALLREARRERAARDLERIIADRATQGPDDVDELARAAASTALDLD